jgi:hypothetical protein
VACVFAAGWVLRVLVVCLARKDGDDLGRALDAVRPAREFRWCTRRTGSRPPGGHKKGRGRKGKKRGKKKCAHRKDRKSDRE